MQLLRNQKITQPTSFQYYFLQFSIFYKSKRWIIRLRPLPVNRMSFRSGFSFSLARRSKQVQLAVSIWLQGLSTVSQQMIQLTVLMSFSMLKGVGFRFSRSQQQLFLYLVAKVLMQVHTTSFNLTSSSLPVTIIPYSVYRTPFPHYTRSQRGYSYVEQAENWNLSSYVKDLSLRKARRTRQAGCWRHFMSSMALMAEKRAEMSSLLALEWWLGRNLRQRYSVVNWLRLQKVQQRRASFLTIMRQPRMKRAPTIICEKMSSSWWGREGSCLRQRRLCINLTVSSLPSIDIIVGRTGMLLEWIININAN